MHRGVGRPLAVVTGASSGLGREIARHLGERGWDLVVTARTRERLEALRDEIVAAHGVDVVVAPHDLARDEGVAGVIDRVGALSRPVDLLVANAGFGLYGPYLETDAAEEAEMLRLNMAAPVALVRGFLPEMLGRGRGRVLLVASLGGYLPGPFTATYYATRAFIVSYAESLAQELAGSGVSVTVLSPGPMPTGFQARAGIRPGAIRFGALPAEQVARAGVAGALAGKRRVVPGVAARVVLFALRLLPRTLVARITARVQAQRG